MSTPSSLRSFQPRQKRQQVSRACDSCRSQRIKCDTEVPCSQCKTRGNECSKIASPALSSLSKARAEIDRLQNEVQDLRRKLQVSNDTTAALHRSTNGGTAITPPETVGTTPENPRSGMSSDHAASAFWPGVQLANGREPQNRSWHGPSSLSFFMSRIADFLSTELHRHQSAGDLAIKGRTGSLLGKTNTLSGSKNTVKASTVTTLERDLQVFATETPLSPTREDYFLDLYWTSIHADSYPILDEEAFKNHYRSLWQHGGNSRAPSALVDIVLALCMQVAFPRGGTQAQTTVGDGNLDAGVAGRWYYKRCQLLLVDEMESPTTATLQCHILSSIYLCSGSFHNMSDTACSLAVRTAYMLGIHLDPSNFDCSPKEQEFRRRLWWATYVQDCKIGLKLGRPFLLSPALKNHGSPSLLSDTMETASSSGSYYVPLGNGKTWLTFHLHVTKLYKLAKSALYAFYNAELPRDVTTGPSSCNSSNALRFHADLLSPYLDRLGEWTKDVPQILHLSRPDGSHPFSTKTAEFSMEQFAPLWLQRQRLTLELMYHHICVCLCRPFIKFTIIPDSMTGESTADGHADRLAVMSVGHATALVKIYHEAVSATSLMYGRNEPFQWLWNAAVTLVGFLLAHKTRSLQHNGHRKATPTGALDGGVTLPRARDNIRDTASPAVQHDVINAREAVNLATGLFDTLGESLGETPRKAAKVVRSLLFKIDAVPIADRTHLNRVSSNFSITEVPSGPTTTSNDATGPTDNSWILNDFHVTQPLSDGGALFWTDLTATQEWLTTTQDVFESAFQVDDYSESIDFNDTRWQLLPTDPGNIA